MAASDGCAGPANHRRRAVCGFLEKISKLVRLAP